MVKKKKKKKKCDADKGFLSQKSEAYCACADRFIGLLSSALCKIYLLKVCMYICDRKMYITCPVT